MPTHCTTSSRGARRRTPALAALAALAGILLLGAPLAPTARARTAGLVSGIRLDNGDSPYAGDRSLLTTVSPNGDSFRDRAAIHVRLAAAATVTLDVEQVATRRPLPITKQVVRLSAGPHRLLWAPPADTEPGTYLALLKVGSATYGATTSASAGRVPTAVVRVQGVDAHFTAESYRPGTRASLSISSDARRLTIDLLHSGPGKDPRVTNKDVFGARVARTVSLPWTGHGNAPHRVSLRIGNLATGLYFAKLTADDGRIGYAPLIVRPERLGEHRVAVVLPTNTWQAYNYENENGDGWGDTWYATWSKSATVRLNRHYAGWGIPPKFRRYDLSFLHWLARRGKAVDFLSDTDLGAVPDAHTLASAYDVVVFPGHHEYVTQSEMTLIRGYRNLGGNLVYLSANNFFWHTARHGEVLRRTAMWRELGEPESELMGDQYRANNGGGNKKPWRVVAPEAAPWLFRGTGLHKGSRFGLGGTEIDERSPASPPGTTVIAAIPNAIGSHSAEMTYYETSAGAKVFSAGAFTLAGQATDRVVRDLMENLWRQMIEP